MPSTSPCITVGTEVVNGEEGIWIHTVRKRKPSLSLGEVEAGPPQPSPPPGVGGTVAAMGPLPQSPAERAERAVARWLHWVTILRSRELEMMDLELMRWKHIGLFYKQLISSPQTVFLNVMFSIRTAGFLGLLAVLEDKTEKATNTLEGPLRQPTVPRTFAQPIPFNKTALGRRYCNHMPWMKKQRL